MGQPLDLKSPYTHRDIFRRMQREWKPHITHSEYAVLEMIFDRTVGWGKEWEFVSFNQFEFGVTCADGSVVHPGCGYTRRIIRESLDKLVQIGLIRKATVKKSCSYAISFSWTPSTNMSLPLPKRLRGKEVGENLPHPGVENTPLGGIPAPQREEERDTKAKSFSPDGERSGLEDAKQRVQAASSDFQERVASRLAARRAKPAATLTRTDLGAVWQTAFRETFQGAVFTPLKDKEMGALRGYLRRWPGTTFGDYLDWCVRHWRIVVQTSFAWMDQPPEHPSVFFLVRFCEKFEAEYNRRAVIEARSRMSPLDRLVAQLHEDQGMEHSAAVDEAEKRLGVARQRQQLEAEVAEVARQRRLLDIQRSYGGGGMPAAPPPRPALAPIEGGDDLSDLKLDFPDTYTP